MKRSLFIFGLLVWGMLGSGVRFVPAQSPQDLIPFSRDMFRSQPILPAQQDAQESGPDGGSFGQPGFSPDYQPENPSDWGAPGDPNSASNIDFSNSGGGFSPDEANSSSLAEAFESASGTDPIELNAPDKFITGDRVRLNAVYYKGSADKTTIPVILLHDRGGKKEDMQPLAEKLAAAGFAVLVPDLRGHGGSTTSWIYDFSNGGNRPAIREKDDYTVDSFTDDDFLAMRQYDGLLWYQFLGMMHNEGKVNLRRLILVGNGYGAAVAVAWLANDWQEPSFKKGRFAKSLILLSPEADPVYKIVADLKGRANLTGMIFVGNLVKNRLTAAQDAQLALGKEKAATAEEDRQFKLVSIKTEKEGMELLSIDTFGVADRITEFIQKENQGNPVGGKWTIIK